MKTTSASYKSFAIICLLAWLAEMEMLLKILIPVRGIAINVHSHAEQVQSDYTKTSQRNIIKSFLSQINSYLVCIGTGAYIHFLKFFLAPICSPV